MRKMVFAKLPNSQWLKIIEILEAVYEASTQNELLFYIANDKDLTKYVVNKSDRKKIKKEMRNNNKNIMV